MFEGDDIRQYDVVRNEAGQYSIWPVSRPVSPGWGKVGRSGSKQECDYMAHVWTDLRVAAARGRDDQRPGGPVCGSTTTSCGCGALGSAACSSSCSPGRSPSWSTP
jgi:MbtH protein